MCKYCDSVIEIHLKTYSNFGMWVNLLHCFTFPLRSVNELYRQKICWVVWESKYCGDLAEVFIGSGFLWPQNIDVWVWSYSNWTSSWMVLWVFISDWHVTMVFKRLLIPLLLKLYGMLIRTIQQGIYIAGWILKSLQVLCFRANWHVLNIYRK